MNTSAHLIERHTGVVDLRVRNRPGIASYVFGAAASLDTAFAGTTTMFTVLTGRSFRSRTLRMNNINRVEESSRGLTKVTYNPNDYASATIPGDANISFVRVAEVDLGGVNLGEGPILVVPPPGFFRTGRSNLALNGTAPNVAGLANNMPPPDAMIIDFPRFTDEITIVNTDAVSLFVSTQVGTQEFEIPTAGSVTFTQTGTSELYLRGETATATFKMFAVIVNGIQG
jgi:hypothetical protein